jgi:hypothetical protein
MDHVGARDRAMRIGFAMGFFFSGSTHRFGRFADLRHFVVFRDLAKMASTQQRIRAVTNCTLVSRFFWE